MRIRTESGKLRMKDFAGECTAPVRENEKLPSWTCMWESIPLIAPFTECPTKPLLTSMKRGGKLSKNYKRKALMFLFRWRISLRHIKSAPERLLVLRMQTTPQLFW